MGHLGLEMNQKWLKVVFLDQKSFICGHFLNRVWGYSPSPAPLQKKTPNSIWKAPIVCVSKLWSCEMVLKSEPAFVLCDGPVEPVLLFARASLTRNSETGQNPIHRWFLTNIWSFGNPFNYLWNIYCPFLAAQNNKLNRWPCHTVSIT